MVLGSTDANRVLLVAEHLVMEEEADLNLFYITDHQLVNVSYPRKGVTMEIKLKRKIIGEMMTTYLPSMLLMMTPQAPNFVQQKKCRKILVIRPSFRDRLGLILG